MPHRLDVFEANISVTERYTTGQNQPHPPSLKMKNLELKSAVESRMPVQSPHPISRDSKPIVRPMFRVVRPSPAVLLAAAIILGTATYVAVPLLAQPLLAQSGEPPKPAEAGKTEPGKTEPSKTEAKPEPAAKPEPGKGGETAKTETGKTEAGKTEAAKGGEPAKDAGHASESAEARTLAGPAGRGECVGLGERVIGLLWKDDHDTAFRHLELYDRFGCPGEHIQVGFRCIVRQGPPQQKDPKFFDDRVHGCWMDPLRPAAAEPVNGSTAAMEKPGAK
jgi:hypothetical protein